MIRIAHTALLALLVGVALVGYGVTEEIRRKRAVLMELVAQQEAVAEEIRVLRLELAHLSSPDRLRDLLRRLHGVPGLRDADGVALAPWRSDQLVDLSAPTLRSAPARDRPPPSAP